MNNAQKNGNGNAENPTPAALMQQSTPRTTADRVKAFFKALKEPVPRPVLEAEEAKEANSLLAGACLSGDCKQARSLLESGAQPNATDEAGRTHLMIAGIKGRLKIAELLVKKGADVNRADHQKQTTLMRAAFRLDAEMVEFLLKKGASTLPRDREMQAALDHAKIALEKEPGKQDAFGRIEALLTKYGRAETKGIYDAELFSACARGDLARVKELVECICVDVNAKNALGETPLMLACGQANNELVKYLLEKGAWADAKSKFGKTALDYANSAVLQETPAARQTVEIIAKAVCEEMNKFFFRRR